MNLKLMILLMTLAMEMQRDYSAQRFYRMKSMAKIGLNI
jgi:hypothetical protein